MRDFLNGMPGPQLTTADVAQRLAIVSPNADLPWLPNKKKARKKSRALVFG
jgi:hypothetical protein